MKQPDLGKKIAELRKAKGLTQEELVEKCNLNVRTLQRIESGEVTPRSYTVKTIFTALGYNVYDSSEITSNKFRNTEFIISNWLEQFYRYVFDLFNLKTNTMKKVTILSIILSAIIFGLFTIVTDSKAQKENKLDSNVSDKISTSESSNSAIIVSGTFNGWDETDEFVGRDVHCTINGVLFKSSLISVNKRTREFHTFVKGKLYKNKVEIIGIEDIGSVKYTADKIYKSEGQILLKGNAKLIHSKGESFEANEMSADNIGGSANKWFLKGNVKMNYSKDESIEADEIIVFNHK
jgi:transcriptional regulator with XRE-family HTH domain